MSAAAVSAVIKEREDEMDTCVRRARRILTYIDNDEVGEEGFDITVRVQDFPTGILRRQNILVADILRYNGFWCRGIIKKKKEHDDSRHIKFIITDMTEEQKAIWLR